MPSKKRLLTFRQNGQWMIYKSPMHRSKNVALKLPEDSTYITDNSLFKKYLIMHYDNVNSALTVKQTQSDNAIKTADNDSNELQVAEEGQIKETKEAIVSKVETKAKKPSHSVGYHLLQFTSTVSSSAAQISSMIGLLNSPFITAEINNSDNSNTQPSSQPSTQQSNILSNVTFWLLLGAILLNATAATSYYIKNRLEDKSKGEIQQFEALENLLEKQSDIEYEIKIKESVLKRLKIFTRTITKSNTNINDSADEIAEEFIQYLEEKDDLNLFESIAETLKHLQAEKYTNNQQTSLAIILQILKDKLVENFYQNNRTNPIFSKLDKIETISQLLKLAHEENKSKLKTNNDKEVKTTDFLYNMIIDLVKDKKQFIALKKLTFLFDHTDNVLFINPITYKAAEQKHTKEKKKQKNSNRKRLAESTEKLTLEPHIELNYRKSLIKTLFDILNKSSIESGTIINNIDLINKETLNTESNVNNKAKSKDKIIETADNSIQTKLVKFLQNEYQTEESDNLSRFVNQILRLEDPQILKEILKKIIYILGNQENFTSILNWKQPHMVQKRSVL